MDIKKIEVWACYFCGIEYKEIEDAYSCCSQAPGPFTRYECSTCLDRYDTEKEAIACYRRHTCPAIEYDHLPNGVRCYFDCFAVCDKETKSAECWGIYDKDQEG